MHDAPAHRELNVRVNKPIVESVLEITLAALLRR
jgi:hypothetical protein